MVEGSDPRDNYYLYLFSVEQPHENWSPVNSKYLKQKSRFINFINNKYLKQKGDSNDK